MENPILVSQLSLLGMTVPTALRKIQRVGFQGLEIFLLPRTRPHTARYRRLVEELGLTLHFHQGWSLDENPTHCFNHVLDQLGLLEEKDYCLSEHIPGDVSEPVVISADRWPETLGRKNLWLQTSSSFRGNDYRINFEGFLRAVETHDLPLVFDTQHYLENVLNVRGVEALPTDPTILFQLLEQGWKRLGSRVREIHLNDCDPRRGHGHGRNLFPGEGILPLQDFCRLVARSGWRGTLVPEVQPRYLFPYSDQRLLQLRTTVETLFEQFSRP